jgi:hypothetical protein
MIKKNRTIRATDEQWDALGKYAEKKGKTRSVCVFEATIDRDESTQPKEVIDDVNSLKIGVRTMIKLAHSFYEKNKKIDEFKEVVESEPSASLKRLILDLDDDNDQPKA